MNSNIVMVIFVFAMIIFNLVSGRPVTDDKSKRNSNNKRPAVMRMPTKSPQNSQHNFMPMVSMQMINRNAMMHNKFEIRQKNEQSRTTKAPVRTTLNPLCTTPMIPIEAVTKGVRPNTIFTSYNWSPSR